MNDFEKIIKCKHLSPNGHMVKWKPGVYQIVKFANLDYRLNDTYKGLSLTENGCIVALKGSYTSQSLSEVISELKRNITDHLKNGHLFRNVIYVVCPTKKTFPIQTFEKVISKYEYIAINIDINREKCLRIHSNNDELLQEFIEEYNFVRDLLNLQKFMVKLPKNKINELYMKNENYFCRCYGKILSKKRLVRYVLYKKIKK